jgi:carbon monoxide dehydrogenase subunit G
MIFDGKIDLEVPAQKAWDFLIDINKFSTCLPGIDEVKQIDDKTFDGVISATVGPISGKFNFRSTILESRPRSRWRCAPREPIRLQKARSMRI